MSFVAAGITGGTALAGAAGLGATGTAIAGGVGGASAGFAGSKLLGGGKGSDDAPPSVLEQSREAVQAQVQNLPDILKAQQEFAPQFTQNELDLLRQFGSQFVGEQVALEREFAPQIAEITRQAQEVLAPERIAAQDLLKDFFGQEAGLSDTERSLIQEQSRAAQSTRGLAETGFGAVEEVRALADLRNQIKQQQLNLALSSASQVPLAGGFSTQVPQVSPGQLVQNVTPSNIFGAQQANQSFNLAQSSQRSDLLGGLIGAGGQLAGQFIGSGGLSPSGGSQLTNVLGPAF